MRIPRFLVAVAAGGLLVASSGCPSKPVPPPTAVKKPVQTPNQTTASTAKRTLWTTSKVKGSPDPPAPYRTQRAFPNLKFAEPLDLVVEPGSDRLFVVERYGKIFSFPNQQQTEQADLFFDFGKVLYGLAFHPQFKQNGYFYVTYIVDKEQDQPQGTRLARFQVSRDHLAPGESPGAKGSAPLHADPKTETLLLEWPSGGHNGGCLKFGPDGFLYVATGDSSGINDERLTGQDVSKLSGAILRIDVDRPDEGKAYGIPADNPFVGVIEPDSVSPVPNKRARPEIWAYGLRQPWKFTFDRQTGDLWTGNVGQDLWEMIFRIERGGNYGWSVTEGTHPFRPQRQRGPTPILPPIVEHDHANFRSITGGYVYHGKQLEDLTGAYIYGDYDTGRIWMLRYDREQKQVTENKELVDSSLRLVGFAEDTAGELYLLDHMSGQISQLVPNPAVATADFPRKLSETGLFASTEPDSGSPDLQPAAGLIPYAVIAPQWCDGAVKQRFLGLPGDSQIEFETLTYPQPAPGAPPGWKFPDGTVIAETISLDMEAGNPASRRRLETRILHHERLLGDENVGDQYWQGYTYVWNDEQTDAVLLEDPVGRDRTFTITDESAPGGQRRQTWHFPSRTECTVCHNMAAKYVLGVTTLQMNRDYDYDGHTTNQLSMLDGWGVFTKPLPKPPAELPRLVDYRDAGHDLGQRARSYLHANCSHCHRKWGGGNAKFQLLSTLELPETGTVGVRPAHGMFNMSDARLLAGGDPYRSVLFYRMAKVGPGRMPRIGSGLTDEAGLKLIHDWIASLPTDEPPEAVAAERELATAALEQLRAADASADERNETIDRLLASTSPASRLAWVLGEPELPPTVRDEVLARALETGDAQVRDLFERFLPEDKRTKRLGNVVRPEEILALPGDVERGRKVFFEAAGVQCRNCHKIGGEGKEVGPDLSEIGKKYPRAELLETILDPSKKIEPKYLTYLAETTAGRVHTGLLLSRTDEEIVLKTAEDKLIQLKPDEVELLVPQEKSLMPDLLLRDLTAEQVADLTAFLSSLR